MRVLIAEDDPDIASGLCASLRRQGHVVDHVDNGAHADAALGSTQYALLVLDLGLPQLDGRDVLQRLRQRGDGLAVLVVTARDGLAERVRVLDLGADDYLVKPFHVEELLARVNALLRRAAGWSKPTLECGPVALDLAAQTVSVAGSNVDLTSYEYKVLEYLMMHAGELVSKADLTEHIYQQDFDRDSNVLEVFIGRLRKKLDPDGELKPIETVRGRGYRFAIPRNEG